jgi:hypothetical protein
MNDQTRQSIQILRENLANHIRIAISRSKCPSVGPPFLHSRTPNTPPRKKRTKFSNRSMQKYLFNCEQFYYTILSKDSKKKNIKMNVF